MIVSHEINAKESIDRLLIEIADNFNAGHQIRTEGYRLALSAALLRLVRFGVEDTLENYSARDILNLLVVGGGPLTGYLINIATSRAIAENDAEVLSLIERHTCKTLMFAWYNHSMSMSKDQLQTEEKRLHDLIQTTQSQPTQENSLGVSLLFEEIHVLRIIMIRRFPELASSSWLTETLTKVPMVAWSLAIEIVHKRKDLHPALSAFLVQWPHILLVREPDLLLEPMIRISRLSPDYLLRPFEGYYGEPCLLAAAEWHIEHEQPQEALFLAEQIRFLSCWYIRSKLVCGLAKIALGEIESAESILLDIDDPFVRDNLLIHLAEHPKGRVTDAVVADIGLRSGTNRPEILVRCLQNLLQRRRLDLARKVAQEVHTNWIGHHTLAPIIEAILQKNALPNSFPRIQP